MSRYDGATSTYCYTITLDMSVYVNESRESAHEPQTSSTESSAYCNLSCVLIDCCLTPGSYGIHKVFPCKSAIGSEAYRAGLIDCDPIAKSGEAGLRRRKGKEEGISSLPLVSLSSKSSRDTLSICQGDPFKEGGSSLGEIFQSLCTQADERKTITSPINPLVNQEPRSLSRDTSRTSFSQPLTMLKTEGEWLALHWITVAKWLACSPPTKALRVQYRAGSLWIFPCGKHAELCRRSTCFLGNLPFPPLFHSGAAPYSPQSPQSALKTSILGAVPISSLTHSSGSPPRSVGMIRSTLPRRGKCAVAPKRSVLVALPQLKLASLGLGAGCDLGVEWAQPSTAQPSPAGRGVPVTNNWRRRSNTLLLTLYLPEALLKFYSRRLMQAMFDPLTIPPQYTPSHLTCCRIDSNTEPPEPQTGGTPTDCAIEGRLTKSSGGPGSNPGLAILTTVFPKSLEEAVVVERLDCSPPTKANRVRSSAGSLPDIRNWESRRTMPLVGGFSRGSPISPAVLLHSHLISPSSTLKASLLRAAEIFPLHSNVCTIVAVNRERNEQVVLKQCSVPYMIVSSTAD
ncbi:hypothetical protein PR048_027405 [Dryococelus australis]|uniref:Uncharacterized protein n=1 Tax=Dryococelus australis TaxID=614101 RepID=A0ABQ9GFD0_9NEOP|nr:hypothetical protein PR048_027405 [Dryococelus australis]